MDKRAGKTKGPVLRQANGWYLFGGVVLAVCSVASMVFSDLFLGHLTFAVGVGFCLAGGAGLKAVPHFRHAPDQKPGAIYLAVLDIAMGVWLIAYPLLFLVIDFWVLGTGFIVYGILRLLGTLPMMKFIPDAQVIMVLAALVMVAIGVLVLVWPASVSTWVAAFALARSVTLIVVGLTDR